MTDSDPTTREVFLTVDGEEDRFPLRVDAFLSELPGLPGRSQLKQRMQKLMVNGVAVKLSTKVRVGDEVRCELLPEPTIVITPEEIPLDVVYEDDWVVAINKPAGMVVHPGAGNRTGTLLHALAGRYKESGFFVSQTGDETEDGTGDSDDTPPDEMRIPRPGIVHRLDKDTSGIIIVAKDTETHGELVKEFAARRTTKRYIALVKGRLPHTYGAIDGAIGRDRRHRTTFCVKGERIHRAISGEDDQFVEGWREEDRGHTAGRAALTTYAVLARFTGYTLLFAYPHTGRTHQIRVHLQSIGHPIVGDKMYARVDNALPAAPLMLHAARLTVTVKGRTLQVGAPVPEAFRSTISTVRDHASR
jgi:23S rRNA pseudouridine1911/1915/1917 synthase